MARPRPMPFAGWPVSATSISRRPPRTATRRTTSRCWRWSAIRTRSTRMPGSANMPNSSSGRCTTTAPAGRRRRSASPRRWPEPRRWPSCWPRSALGGGAGTPPGRAAAPRRALLAGQPGLATERPAALDQQPVQHVLDRLAHLVRQLEHDHRIVDLVGVLLGGDGRPEVDHPLGRQRYRAERTQPRECRCYRHVGQAQRLRHRRDIAYERVDLLRADDRNWDDRRAVPQRSRYEAAAAETLQLVALAELLADPLEALWPDPDQLTGAKQPVDILVAGQRVAGFAGQMCGHRQLEHEVGGEQSQVPASRMVIVDSQLRHQ